jgi:hypothetical protein
MPLSAFKDGKEEVRFGPGEDETFDVRAISLPDVAMLISVHDDAISMIAMMVRENKEAFRLEDSTQISDMTATLIGNLIRESPLLVANLIAVCADEPTMMSTVSRLPITVQLDAISKIAKLTFTDLASVKKLIADVMSIVKGILPPETSAAA